MTIQPSIPAAAELAALRAVAALLLPGDAESPAADVLPDLDANLARALAAVGAEAGVALRAAAALPYPLEWDELRAWAAGNREEFEVLSTVIAGAYFMSPASLDAIGYPHGPRRRAPHDLAVEELSSGLLDPMLARASTVREVPA